MTKKLLHNRELDSTKKCHILSNRIFLTILCLAASLSIKSQTAREEIANDVYLSGYYLTAYPTPQQQNLTPAPIGKTPFYISHYGRHGSRWLSSASNYEKPITELSVAESSGVLSDFGKQILNGLRLLAADASDRYEELTPIGAKQLQEIGKRMTSNFPEVFSDSCHIDAKSTTYSRCILSMENMLMELKAFNPRMKITHNASARDMYYLLSGFSNNSSSASGASPANALSASVPLPKVDTSRLMAELFTDSSYVSENINELNFFTSLLEAVSSLQNTELRDSISLYELFNDEELYQGWRRKNVSSYNSYHKGTTAKALLHHIIDDADNAISSSQPSVNLRFGHEIVLMPIVCLMRVNDLDKDWSTPDELEAAGWRNYSIYPMAGNLQIIFYRSSPADNDILVKILLNEKEATLPISTDMSPYYHWNDVRELWQGLTAGSLQ